MPSLEGKFWETENPDDSFSVTQRLIFKREKIDVKIVKKESDDTIKFELFQRLNTLGSKLSDQEVRNCLLVMLNREFYTWLKALSEDEHFLNTISLADRLIDEKYNMELALRFLIISSIDPNEVRSLNDFSEFVTEKMILIAEDEHYDKVENERIFRETFKLLDETLSEQAFKKYVVDKDKFEGKFLLASYEALAIGIGKNIDAWLAQPHDEAQQTNLRDKIKGIWQNPQFLARYGSGVNVTSRVPVIVPLGAQVFVP